MKSGKRIWDSSGSGALLKICNSFCDIRCKQNRPSPLPLFILFEPIRLRAVFCTQLVVDLKNKLLISFFVLCLYAPGVMAQADSLSSKHALGAEVVLTNSGFGLGGFVSSVLSGDYSLLIEASLGSVKDEREVAFFDRFGQRDVPNKANFLLELPIQVGLQKRLFKSQIEDNFRPFIHLSIGPVLGWKYPYFDDENKNGAFDSDERTFDVLSGLPNGSIEPGLGAGFFLGAHFGQPGGEHRGVRLGYRLTVYKNKIALLEPSIKPPTRRIGSPVIMVYFGKLLPRGR